MNDILCQFHSNGTSMFILAIIFYIALHHLILFNRNKDISYLYYGFYALFLFIAYSLNVKNNFYSQLIAPFFKQIYSLRYVFAGVYAFFYFKFALELITVNKLKPKLFKLLNRLILIFISYVIISHIFIFLLNKQDFLESNFKFIMAPQMLVIFIITLYFMIISKNVLSKYLLFGSSVLLIGSLFSLFIFNFHFFEGIKCLAHPIVFGSLLLENIIFSLALGKKQRLILEEKIEYEKQLNEEKLNLLRSNLNPHFIFNVLNSIKYSIIQKDVRSSTKSLNIFAKLMRLFLNSTQETEHTLEKELEMLELYIKAENIRYEEPVEFNVFNNSNLDYKTILVPSMIFQTFIENIIKHGFTFTTENKKIDFILNVNDSFLDVKIIDNGKGLKEKFTYREKSGLSITKKRIAFFSKKLNSISKIKINNNTNKRGVVVEIRMPIKYYNN